MKILPTGDRVLTESPDDIWGKVDLVTEDDGESIWVFSQLVQKISRPVRNRLRQMWAFENEPREDGGQGFSPVDALWHCFIYLGASEEQLAAFGCNSPRQLIEQIAGWSPSFIEAMRQALETAGLPGREELVRLAAAAPLCGGRFPGWRI